MDRTTFFEIYPDLQIMVGIHEIRFQDGMTWNKFEQCIKDIVRFNKDSLSGQIPSHILSQFKDNSREHLVKYFQRKYEEIRGDRARMLASDLRGFVGARDSGAANRRAGIANEARRAQALRASAAADRLRMGRLSRSAPLRTFQLPGHNRLVATVIPPGLSRPRVSPNRGRTMRKSRSKRTKGPSPQARRSTRSRTRTSNTPRRTRSRAPSRTRRP